MKYNPKCVYTYTWNRKKILIFTNIIEHVLLYTEKAATTDDFPHFSAYEIKADISMGRNQATKWDVLHSPSMLSGMEKKGKACSVTTE